MKASRNSKVDNSFSLFIDGKTAALRIKTRCKTLGLTVTAVFAEADVSYSAYRSWRSYGQDPSAASLKKIEAVLTKYEAANA